MKLHVSELAQILIHCILLIAFIICNNYSIRSICRWFIYLIRTSTAILRIRPINDSFLILILIIALIPHRHWIRMQRGRLSQRQFNRLYGSLQFHAIVFISRRWFIMAEVSSEIEGTGWRLSSLILVLDSLARNHFQFLSNQMVRVKAFIVYINGSDELFGIKEKGLCCVELLFANGATLKDKVMASTYILLIQLSMQSLWKMW